MRLIIKGDFTVEGCPFIQDKERFSFILLEIEERPSVKIREFTKIRDDNYALPK